MNKKTEKILDELGWSVDCESPLELSHEDGSSATGQAADYLVGSLMEEYEWENKVQEEVDCYNMIRYSHFINQLDAPDLNYCIVVNSIETKLEFEKVSEFLHYSDDFDSDCIILNSLGHQYVNPKNNGIVVDNELFKTIIKNKICQ